MMDEQEMYRQVQRGTRWNRIALGVLAALVLMLLAGFGVYRWRHTWTADKWRSRPEERVDIVSDLLEKYQLKGMTEAETVALLGPEDGDGQTSFKGDQTEYDPEQTLVYYLGVDFMDCAWLVISLEQGVVAEYTIGVT